MEIIDNKLIGELLAKAGASARLRRDLDLRTSVLVLPIIAIFVHLKIDL